MELDLEYSIILFMTDGYEKQSSAPLYIATAVPAPGYVVAERRSTKRISLFRMGTSSLSGDEKMGLVKKVYGIMTTQLLLTFGLAILAAYSPSFGSFCRSTPVVVISLIMILLSGGATLCFHQYVPWNYLFAAIFALSFGFLISWLTSFFEYRTVLLAVGITVSATAAITILSLMLSEVVVLAFVLVILCVAILVYLIVFFAFASVAEYAESPRWAFALYCSVGVMIYSAYIAIDAQIVASGVEVDEYIPAAVIVYMHVIMLFLYILMMLGAKK